jgi:ubiquinone/menaquinone biosynthesis C-methylase UbiE
LLKAQAEVYKDRRDPRKNENTAEGSMNSRNTHSNEHTNEHSNDHQIEVEQHYSYEQLFPRVEGMLREAGLSQGLLAPEALSPLDQFHIRGLEASRELARDLKLCGGEHVLDIGAGFGGPARYLATEFGCRVTGIDLNKTFVQIANYLTERCRLNELVQFVCGDATNLPFPAHSFDHAWMQHVSMNIKDKAALLKGIQLVLKANGRLALYEVLSGSGESLFYPVPWAADERISFLVSEEEMLNCLKSAGFANVACTDVTEQSLAWLKKQAEQRQLTPAPPLSLASAIGETFPAMLANLLKNTQQNRIRICRIIAQKA